MSKMSVRLNRSPTAPATARAWLSDALPRPAMDGRRADVLVMASELVANVLQHTDSCPVLALEQEPGAVRISVSDDVHGAPEVAIARPAAVGGNGLRIVAAWSDHWGVDRHPADGKTVWFVVNHPVAP